ncbi:MAG TPA: cell division protein ZapB [Geobacteraceae bacterium]|nr:cell division protein ZapB [Geobacteraceae bacterium]
MDIELLDTLEGRIAILLAEYKALKQENQSLREENRRLQGDRDGFKERIDLILKKLEGIEVH